MTSFKNRTVAMTAIAIGVALIAGSAPVVADEHSEVDLTIYFTRHGEKQTVLVQVGKTGHASEYTTVLDNNDFEVLGPKNRSNSKAKRYEAVCGDDKCAEELSDRGELYAELLAEWFESNDITGDIDAVYATHKTRTQQTVAPTADRANNLEVIQLPAFNSDGVTPATELNPQGTSSSECPTLAAIAAAQMDSTVDTIVIAGHSGTLYDIMGEGNSGCLGLGLDMSAEELFPKDEDGKVRFFGDLWKVDIIGGEAELVWRKSLKPTALTAVGTFSPQQP